jgi:hypothetical protein
MNVEIGEERHARIVTSRWQAVKDFVEPKSRDGKKQAGRLTAGTGVSILSVFNL